ncbi:MAG: acyl-CoA dehydrogenase family protein [bacterium]
MNFELNEEERKFEEALSRFLHKSGYPDRACEVQLEKDFERGLYTEMCSLGFLFPDIPEEAGGGGLPSSFSVIPFRLLGKYLFPSPALDSYIALSLMSQDERLRGTARETCGGAKMFSTAISGEEPAEGKRKGGKIRVRSGEKFAFYAGDADGLVVDVLLDGGRVPLLLLKGEYEAERIETMSDGQTYAVRCDAECSEERILGNSEDLDSALCRMWMLSSAEMLGMAEGAFERAVAYSNERIQFSRTIGSFQAVRHMLADDYMNIRGCGFMVHEAAYLCGIGAEDWKGASALAFLMAEETSEAAAKNSHQVHGAMGFTTEMPIHLYYKRAKSIGKSRGDRRAIEETILAHWNGPLWIKEEDVK